MQKYLNVLKVCGLFCSLSETEILSSLDCLKPKLKTFNKGSIIFLEGDEAIDQAIILSGSVELQKIDYNGNSNIVSKLYPSDMIASSAIYSKSKTMPFDAVCTQDSVVLFIDNKKLTSPCCKSCVFHNTMIENLLSVLADNNIRLANKIEILTKRTIREKILAFLFTQSKKQKGKIFSVPLNRQQMADYLSTDRSALSRELCFMRDEGLLEFEGNSFKLLN